MNWHVLFYAVVAWLVLNAAAFTMMTWDKSASQNAMRRIPEANLLFVALIGGSAGAVLGQQLLRHKTRKEPFRSILFGIVALHCAATSYFLFRLLLDR